MTPGTLPTHAAVSGSATDCTCGRTFGSHMGRRNHLTAAAKRAAALEPTQQEQPAERLAKIVTETEAATELVARHPAAHQFTQQEQPAQEPLVHLMGDSLLDACGTAPAGVPLVVAPFTTPEQITCPACQPLVEQERRRVLEQDHAAALEPCTCHGCRTGNDCIGEGSAFWQEQEQPATGVPSRGVGAQAVMRVTAAALHYANTQGLPVEGLSVALAHIVDGAHDVSLYCWEWPAEDLERWALEHAPALETWGGENWTARRGVVQVADVRLQVAVIVRTQKQEKGDHDA